METPDIPLDEAARLRAVRLLGILDSAPDERFDRLTRMARRLFDAPISLVSVVDERRQWFKSCNGLPITETPRDMAFCEHAILSRKTLVVPDALVDSRFADNRLVTGAPGIRFYAGRPLWLASGFPIGTLCIFDVRPRHFSPRDEAALNDLGAMAESELNAMDTNRQLVDTVQKLTLAQNELISQERLTSLGAMVAGISHELNTPIGNAMLLASSIEENSRRLLDLLAHPKPRREEFVELLQNEHELARHAVESIGRAAQLVTSFKQVAVDQTSALRRQFDLRKVVGDMVGTISIANKLQISHIEIQNQVTADVICDSYPGPLGQVVNNLLHNAIVHGFADRPSGKIEIACSMQGNDTVLLSFSDNGVGIPTAALAHIFDPFFTTTLGRGGSGLGLTIVYRIATTILGGTIEVISQPGKGSMFLLTFPRSAPFRL